MSTPEIPPFDTTKLHDDDHVIYEDGAILFTQEGTTRTQPSTD